MQESKGSRCVLLICTLSSSMAESYWFQRDPSISGELISPKLTKNNPIEGAWYLVKGVYNDVERNDSPFQFKLFGVKHFSFLMKSQFDQEWRFAGTGTYNLNGNTYTETFEFCSYPDFVGVTADFNFQVNGDTMVMEGPTRLVDKNGTVSPDLVGGLNSMYEMRIRAR